MTKKKIQQVRNKIIGLCLEPGQFVKAATDFYGVPFVEIYVVNGCPMFRYKIFSDLDVMHEFYLKSEGWLYHKHFKGSDGGWSLAFNEPGYEPYISHRHKDAEVVWKLVKHYARHFPFVTADNYFIKNGEFVA